MDNIIEKNKQSVTQKKTLYTAIVDYYIQVTYFLFELKCIYIL